MSKRFILAGIIYIALLSMTLAMGKREIKITECGKPPQIDGVINDPCWQNAAETSDFQVYVVSGRKLCNTGKKTKDTKVLLTRDKQFIYFAFECNNPNMRFLDQHGVNRDDQGVFKDDCIEIFLFREGLPYYFHYGLNYANVRVERRVVIGGGRDLSWSYPWMTATVTGKKGWTAEVAIPLEVINAKNPGQVMVNFLRNKINVELDAMGAKNSEKKEYQFWAPVINGAHEPESFGIISGLRDTNRAPAPLLVELDNLKTEELNISGNEFFFNISSTLLGVSPTAGDLIVEVIEKNNEDLEKCIISKNMHVPPRCQEKLSLKIPVNDFSPKTLFLRLKNKSTGMVLDCKKIPFSGNTIKEAYAEFSFYSFEKTLRVKAVMGLSANTLNSMLLKLINQNGKILAEVSSPSTESLLICDANCLSTGLNALTLSLTRNDGKVMGSKKLNVTRLEGRENESKVDHFRRITIFKGKPYFPFGMYDGIAAKMNPTVLNTYITFFRSAKMNTFIGTRVCSFSHKISEDDFKTQLDTMAKANINFIAWGGVQKAAPEGELKKLKTKEEKEKLCRNLYENKFKENILRRLKILKDQPNFLSWYGLDEPNLLDWQTRLYVQKLFHATIKKADPYHVMFGLYARGIPRVSEATDLYDILAYDIYTFPNWEGRAHSRICAPIATQTAQLDQRAAEKRQPIWIVSQPAALDPHRCPRPLSGQEVMCQTYTALIYGAKGIMYFHYTFATSEETRNALRTLGKQITVFSPAVLNYPVKQTITYASGTYDVARWKIPPLPLRLFRFPDGKLIALAVNSNDFPIDVTVKIKDLISASRMFGNKTKFALKANGFTDKLEPYGIRTYALTCATKAENLKVSVKSKLHPKLAPPAIPGNQKLLAEVKTRKNKVLNPSFELHKLVDSPDFYSPYGVINPGDYVLDNNNPKFGKVSLRITKSTGFDRDGVLGLYKISGTDIKPWTFSFYARANRDKTSLWVGLPGPKGWISKKFNLSTEWKRYSMPNLSLNKRGKLILMQIYGDISSDHSVWLDGLQMEKSTEATEFSK